MQTAPVSPTPHVHRNLPLFLSGIAFLFIVLGVGSIFFLQTPLQTENQDTRKAAAVDTGLVTLASNFQDISTTDSNVHLSLSINTHGVQTDGAQVIFNVITDTTENVNLSVPANSGLRATHQEVEKTADGFLISLTTVPQSGTSFSSNQNRVFATISFKPTKAGEIRLAFDEGNSVSHVAGSNPLRDELKTIPAFSHSTIGAISTTTSPTNNDDLFFDAPRMSIRFYKTDSSGQNISENDLQTNGYYKAQVTFQVQNTYKNQSADTRSLVVQYLRNGAPIASKVYTYAFVTNHQDGFSDTFTDYFYFQPNTQFTLNVDTTNSIAETNESNNSWTFTINPSGNSSCNVSCSSNQNCATNFRCYNNQCRLATNVTSDSCSTPPDLGLHRQCNEYCADTRECSSGFTCFFNRCRRPENPDNASCAGLSTSTAQAIAKTCNISCSSNKDCGVNLRCTDGACRLATNVSSLSCSPLTYRTVSVVYQNQGGSSTGTKGEEISLPSVNPSPSSFVYPSLSPGATNSAVSTNSATSTMSALIRYPSPSPTVIIPSPTPIAARNNFIQSISGVIGSSLASIAIAAGVGLLILALVAAVLNRSRRGPKPIGTPPKTSAPQTSTPPEAKLAERIQELKQQQKVPTVGSVPPNSSEIIKPPPSVILAKPVAPPPPIFTPPTQPSKTTSSSGAVSLSSLRTPVAPSVSKPTPSASLPVPKAAPAILPSPVSAPVPPPTSSALSTMMQKIKSKGLDQQIPQPVRSSDPTKN